MVNHYKLERPLTINKADGSKVEVEPGKIILTEATGELSFCDEADLDGNIARIDADIVVRDAAIEAARLAEQEAEQPPE